MQEKATDLLAAAGYTTGTVGMGVGTWMAANWLALLSAASILLTIVLQLRQDRRAQRLLEAKHDESHSQDS